MPAKKKRYAMVGTGGRGVMWADAAAGRYPEHAALVGLCDPSPTRMNWYNDRLAKKFSLPPVPKYAVADFDRMLAEQRPDILIVASIDSTHHEYIVRAMEKGLDVITEKPMTIDAPKARQIFDAIRRTGRKLRVGFNYRYTPGVSRVRELLKQRILGTIMAVDFQWVLDTRHGADYFRRWHREKDKSGGLLVHKATHHFDLVNWWIESVPKIVFAMGDLRFYGKRAAEARGERYAYERYSGHPEAASDPFALYIDGTMLPGDLPENAAHLKGLYFDAEKDSGYIRDRNVFGEPITIEDTHAVMVRYRNGITMSYSLIAYNPWEGLRIALTGDKGRLEYSEKHGSHVIAGQSAEELAAELSHGQAHQLRVFPMFGKPYDVPIPPADGEHGGGDGRMLDHMFLPDPPPDTLDRAADHIAGAASMLVGISANESIRTGMPVRCDDLLPLP